MKNKIIKRDSEILDELNDKVDYLINEMGKFARFMIDTQQKNAKREPSKAEPVLRAVAKAEKPTLKSNLKSFEGTRESSNALKHSREEELEFIRLRKQGLTYAEIKKRTGTKLAVSTLSDICRKYGNVNKVARSVPVVKRGRVTVRHNPLETKESVAWKKSIYKIIDDYNGGKGTNATWRATTLRYLYQYLRNNYGVVWEQEAKEVKEEYGLEHNPRTIDLVYHNKTYRSIFTNVLKDMVDEKRA